VDTADTEAGEDTIWDSMVDSMAGMLDFMVGMVDSMTALLSTLG
jgi:hypothetical protein